MNQTICVMGANPAWQKTLFFPEWKPGSVNRAARMEEYASGKGINFCRAARCFGQCGTLLFQFAGGPNGDRLCAELDREGFRHNTIRTASATRTCVTCLDAAGGMTELIEPSGPASPEECARFLAELRTSVSTCGMLAITGSLPDGTGQDLYLHAARTALSAGIPVLADIVRNAEFLLDLKGRIILKVNREEFLKITGSGDLSAALSGAAGRYPHVVFAITNGPDCAYLSAGGICRKYSIPHLERIASPLGAGDTAAAVLASCLLNGDDIFAAFRSALAAASANCLSAMAGSFAMADFERFSAQIAVSECR